MMMMLMRMMMQPAAASLPCSNSLQKPHIRRQLFWLISKRVFLTLEEEMLK